MRVRLVGSLLPAALVVVTGCNLEGLGDSQRFKEDFHYTYALKAGGRVSVENFNGSVEILGWEKDSVDVSGTKYAATEPLLKEIKIDVAATAEAVRIRTVRPGERHGNLGARYVLRVPYKTALDRIESSNGAMRIEGIEAAARLRTTNGSVRVTKVRGELDIQTSNGALDIADSSGPAMLRTSNGSITVDGLRGSVDATTSNGRIRARLAQLEAGRPVRAQTTNGSVDLTLETFKDTDVRAGTTNGAIVVRVPSSASARLRASTSNSTVATDFDVLVKGGIQAKTRLEGTIGGGGALIDLSSTNGSIKLLKL